MIQQSFKNQKPTLYLVATPIGNLEELTPRAINILNSVDTIAAEDTRNSKYLLNHFSIDTPMIAYHDFNETKAATNIINQLQNGKDIALISDAGYPLISDPGYILVNKVIEKGFNVVPISGSSAFLNALVASGLIVQPFAFMGFLEAKETALKKQLIKNDKLDLTLIYYLSVHKVEKTLEIMYDVLGERNICLARELTKKHEEFIRGPLSEVIQSIETQKGEYVLIIEPDSEQQIDIEGLIKKVSSKIEAGNKTSQAISEVAKEHKFSKNILYDAYHNTKEK